MVLLEANFSFWDILSNFKIDTFKTLSFIALAIAFILFIFSFKDGELSGITILLVAYVIYSEYGHTKQRLWDQQRLAEQKHDEHARTIKKLAKLQQEQFIKGCSYDKAYDKALMFLKNRNYHVIEVSKNSSFATNGRCSAIYYFTVKRLLSDYDWVTGRQHNHRLGDKMYKIWLTVERYNKEYEYTDAKLFKDVNINANSLYENIL